MLRLSRGWTVEQLARAWEEEGTGTPDRGAISKIENDLREIKAREVEGVARIFGLTMDELVKKSPKIFLSYAENEATKAAEIITWLTERGFQVVTPAQAPPHSGQGRSAWIRHAIHEAQAFVGLVSPRFFSSSQRREELEFAASRTRETPDTRPGFDFVYLLQIAETPNLTDAGHGAHPLADLTQASTAKQEKLLSRFGASILLGSQVAQVQDDPADDRPDDPMSLSRRADLDRVLDTIASRAGPHFWLVVSPLGLGKSWFLRRLAAEAAGPGPANWTTTSVDMRRSPADAPPGAMAVVRELFGVEPPPSPEEPDDELVRIAVDVIQAGHPRLCLLDSAELLPAHTVKDLRGYLSRIYQFVQEAGSTTCRFALIVASRQAEGWLNLTSHPRLATLKLDEFGLLAIQDALTRLASAMERPFTFTGLREDAALVRKATEGVPALITKSLEWIQAEQWLAIQRLAKPPLFEKIIDPYIRTHLLSLDSLLPGATDQAEKLEARARVLGEALHHLAPYRFFTQSHVRHHLEADPSFREALVDAGWRQEDLWQAITGIALLVRPLGEPWQELHAAIRRLLYRHFYPREAQAAEAHRAAFEFTQEWASGLTGREQVVGLVECIWHEAASLKLADAAKVGGVLVGFARKQSRDIRESAAYSLDELRTYAADRIASDEELRRALADTDGLFERIIHAVQDPESAGDVV
jgi:transcriptional regulator with XRE-family HTH domain